MFDTVILDWSGTLVDDLDAVLQGTNEALERCGLPPLTRADFRRRFDLPVERFYRELCPGISRRELEEGFQRGFRRASRTVRPLPSTRGFLEHATRCGVRLFVLTTLDRENAEAQLRRFRLHRFFEQVHAGVPDKVPYLARLVRECGLDRERTVFVGDLPHDIEAGRAARVRTCGVLSGYSTRTRLAASGADRIVRDVGSLRRDLREGLVRPAVPPRVEVEGLVFDGEGRLLLVEATRWLGRLAAPGGEVRRGETAERALRERVRESTGWTIRAPRFLRMDEIIDSSHYYRRRHLLLLQHSCETRSRPGSANGDVPSCWVRPERALDLRLARATRRAIEEVLRIGR